MPTETLPAEDMEAAQHDDRPTKLPDFEYYEHGYPEGHPRHPDSKKRKTRKDAGLKRPEKPKPAPAGVLTAEQVEKLAGMVEAIIRIQIDQQSLSIKADAVKTEYYAYLLELQGK